MKRTIFFLSFLTLLLSCDTSVIPTNPVTPVVSVPPITSTTPGIFVDPENLYEPEHEGNWDVINNNVSCHDPVIIKEGAKGPWWMFGTGVGIEVKSSPDGNKWTGPSKVFRVHPSWTNKYIANNPDKNLWAPDIHYYNGIYYLFYSASTFGSNTSAIGLATSRSLTSPNWIDTNGPIIKSDSSKNYNCIDPYLVFDKTGTPWLAFGSFWSGLKIIQLNPTTMRPQGNARVQSIASRNGGAIESPSIFYRNGYYYLFASIDKCCQGANSTYKIVYGRSTNITGPYLDKNGRRMMDGHYTLFDTGNQKWKGPGGQSFYGPNVMAHHAYDSEDRGWPKLLIKTIYWDSDWPYKE